MCIATQDWEWIAVICDFMKCIMFFLQMDLSDSLQEDDYSSIISPAI